MSPGQTLDLTWCGTADGLVQILQDCALVGKATVFPKLPWLLALAVAWQLATRDKTPTCLEFISGQDLKLKCKVLVELIWSY